MRSPLMRLDSPSRYDSFSFPWFISARSPMATVTSPVRNTRAPREESVSRMVVMVDQLSPASRDDPHQIALIGPPRSCLRQGRWRCPC